MSAVAVGMLLTLTSVSAPLPEQPFYRWKFEKGQTFYQEVTTESEQRITVAGTAETATKQRQIFLYRFTPLRQEGDGWVVSQVVEGLRGEVDLGGNKITFDSTRPDVDQSPLTKFYRAFGGWECRLTLDGDRKVTRVEGIEELKKRLTKDDPDTATGLGAVLTEDVVREMAGHNFNALPGREAGKRESYTRTRRLDMGPVGRWVTTYEFAYAGKEDKLEKFTLAGAEMTYQAPEAGAGTLPFVVKKGDFKTKKADGFLLFDPRRGRLERSKLTLKLEGTLEIEIGGNVSSLSLSQTQKVTVKTTDGNPWKKADR
jgi:hypothetical protein